jgi:hypothetical protein
MAEERSTEWPHFRLLPYTAPTGIPHGWDAELLDQGRQMAWSVRLSAN